MNKNTHTLGLSSHFWRKVVFRSPKHGRVVMSVGEMVTLCKWVFHKWGIPNSWMVYRWFRGTPFQETSKWGDKMECQSNGVNINHCSITSLLLPTVKLIKVKSSTVQYYWALPSKLPACCQHVNRIGQSSWCQLLSTTTDLIVLAKNYPRYQSLPTSTSYFQLLLYQLLPTIIPIPSITYCNVGLQLLIPTISNGIISTTTI